MCFARFFLTDEPQKLGKTQRLTRKRSETHHTAIPSPAHGAWTGVSRTSTKKLPTKVEGPELAYPSWVMQVFQVLWSRSLNLPLLVCITMDIPSPPSIDAVQQGTSPAFNFGQTLSMGVGELESSVAGGAFVPRPSFLAPFESRCQAPFVASLLP